ncbi:MAG: DUF6992 family protein [Candidatus Thorarchaeota archaeon]
MTSLEHLNKTLGNILMIWSTGSIVVGTLLFFFSYVPILQGIGLQAMLWGLINLVLAVKLLKQEEHTQEKTRRELSISLGLDLIYPIIGLPLLFLGPDAYLVGNGYGIIIQGAFLLALDLAFLRRFKQLS